jgi:hypothetical protein
LPGRWDRRPAGPDRRDAGPTRQIERVGPLGVGLSGRSDAVQLTFAVHESRVCLTAIYRDYDELHLLVKEANGNHPGILVVRQDNDPARDLTPKGIVAAIRKLAMAGVPIANEYVILNHWR